MQEERELTGLSEHFPCLKSGRLPGESKTESSEEEHPSTPALRLEVTAEVTALAISPFSKAWS